MPYKSDQKLDDLIKAALEHDDIKRGLAASRLTPAHLVKEAKREPEKVWAVATPEIDEYDKLAAELEAKEAEVTKRLPREPAQPFIRLLDAPPDPPPWAGVAALALSLILAATYVTHGLLYGWRRSIWFFDSTAGNVAVGALLSGVALFGATFLIPLLLEFIGGFRRARRARARLLWRERKEALEEKEGVTSLRSRLVNLQGTIDAALIEKAIKERMRAAINRWEDPSYETRLTILEAPGLAEVIDPTRTIDTDSRARLDYMLKNMPGGSIGIAGPRGAGKSTLIHAYCGPKRSKNDLDGHPILPVLVSAPVKYDARDFILYLFASACRSVLEAAKMHVPGAEVHDDERLLSAALNPRSLRYAAIALRLLRSAGIALLILSLAAAVLLAAYPDKPAAEKPAAESAAAAETAQQTAAADEAAKQTTQTQESSGSAKPPPPPFPVRVVKALKFEPGTIMVWGVCLIVVGVAGHWRLSRIWEREQRPERERERREFSPAWYDGGITRTADEESLRPLAEDARRWLKAVKFQLSYTSGWSGALKLPVGLEGGLSRAVTMSERQMSNPEIVSIFTKFLASVPENYRVVIGIDELDKLESDDQAQLFLNEIKSVFGLQRCFYLISVSENAMSNFEQRGLPFRDVFDSSFDSIIYVDYLSLAAAKKLIEGRVIGKPVPFFCLSYCLSGGLARDLIRAFRSLLELRQKSPEANGLTALCHSLVAAELTAKVRATAVSVKKVEAEPEVKQFLERLHDLAGAEVSAPALLRSLRALHEWQVSDPPPTGEVAVDQAEARKRRGLRALKGQLCAYLYFLITLLEFFDDSLTREALEAAEKKGLDVIARARQNLALDPEITVKLLNDFRESRTPKLAVPDFLSGRLPPPPAPPNNGDAHKAVTHLLFSYPD